MNICLNAAFLSLTVVFILACKPAQKSLVKASLSEVRSECETPAMKKVIQDATGNDKSARANLAHSIESYERMAERVAASLLIERVLATARAPTTLTATAYSNLVQRAAPSCLALVKTCEGAKSNACEERKHIVHAYERTYQNWLKGELITFAGEPDSERNQCVPMDTHEAMIATPAELQDISAALERTCKPPQRNAFERWLDGTSSYAFSTQLDIASRVFDLFDSRQMRTGFCAIQARLAKSKASAAVRDSVMPFVQMGVTFGAQTIAGMLTAGTSVLGAGQAIDISVFAAGIAPNIARLLKLEAKEQQGDALVRTENEAKCGPEEISRERERVSRLIAFDSIGQFIGSAFAMIGGGRVASGLLKSGSLVLADGGVFTAAGKRILPLPVQADIARNVQQALSLLKSRVPAFRNLDIDSLLATFATQWNRLTTEGTQVIHRSVPGVRAAAKVGSVSSARVVLGEGSNVAVQMKGHILDFQFLGNLGLNGWPNTRVMMSHIFKQVDELSPEFFSARQNRAAVVSVAKNGHRTEHFIVIQREAKTVDGANLLDAYGREKRYDALIRLPEGVDPRNVSLDSVEQFIESRLEKVSREIHELDKADGSVKKTLRSFWDKAVRNGDASEPFELVLTKPSGSADQVLPYFNSGVIGQ